MQGKEPLHYRVQGQGACALQFAIPGTPFPCKLVRAPAASIFGGGGRYARTLTLAPFFFSSPPARNRCMKFASQVARILGPRGLMPNPKLGTVADDVADIMKRLNSGVPFKADKEVRVMGKFLFL